MDDFDHVARTLEQAAHEVGEPVTNAQLQELGHLAVTIIAARTKQGLDADGKPFEKYTDEYAKIRTKRGLSTKPDLALDGHMIGAMTPKVTGPGEATIGFASPLEATKAAVHNYGLKKQETVKEHSVRAYIRRVERYTVGELTDRVERARRLYQKTGKEKHLDSLVRAKELLGMHLAGKGPRRKQAVARHNKGSYTRDMDIKRREFFDIRLPRELDLLGEVALGAKAGNFQKTIK